MSGLINIYYNYIYVLIKSKIKGYMNMYYYMSKSYELLN